MYRIIGVDQREYGPATAEQVRAWVTEGRANRHTLCRLESSMEWKSLGELSEFSDRFQTTPSPQGETWAGMEPEAIADQVLARSHTVSIASCFSRSWELLMRHFWIIVAASAVVFILRF